MLPELERLLSEPESLAAAGSLLEQPSRPKPLFSHCLPCGLNGFRSPLFPPLAANRSCFSRLLPMASADEAAVFLLAHLEVANDQQELNLQHVPPSRGSKPPLVQPASEIKPA